MAYCPALMNHSVGRDPAMHHTFDPNNPNLATFFGGSWYSVPSQAECPEGVAPGESCAWRLQPGKEGKTANASCVADRVMAPIEANGKACYSKCPQPLDRKSECYFSCLEPGESIPCSHPFLLNQLRNGMFGPDSRVVYILFPQWWQLSLGQSKTGLCRSISSR